MVLAGDVNEVDQPTAVRAEEAEAARVVVHIDEGGNYYSSMQAPIRVGIIDEVKGQLMSRDHRLMDCRMDELRDG